MQNFHLLVVKSVQHGGHKEQYLLPLHNNCSHKTLVFGQLNDIFWYVFYVAADEGHSFPRVFLGNILFIYGSDEGEWLKNDINYKFIFVSNQD